MSIYIFQQMFNGFIHYTYVEYFPLEKEYGAASKIKENGEQEETTTRYEAKNVCSF